MAAVTSCENTLYLACDDTAQFWESTSVKVRLLTCSYIVKHLLCFVASTLGNRTELKLCRKSVMFKKLV